ncbi:MAG TPA: hypothetical protein VFO76_01555 [Candidatus Kapabacteria bacterium]|nr:hypothetical protein [Candidatus Kapabacteria bacterium]
MQSIKAGLLLLFFCSLSVSVLAQPKKPQACTLITNAEIKQLLGVALEEPTSNTLAAYCSRKASSKIEAVVQYVDGFTASSATMLCRSNFDGIPKQLAIKKKVSEAYTTFKPMPEAGAYAYYLTGESDGYGGVNLVRFQFTVGQYLITFDTKGIDMPSVIAKLPEIYKLIKSRLQ